MILLYNQNQVAGRVGKWGLQEWIKEMISIAIVVFYSKILHGILEVKNNSICLMSVQFKGNFKGICFRIKKIPKGQMIARFGKLKKGHHKLEFKVGPLLLADFEKVLD